MLINANTDMLLFRYGNISNISFVGELLNYLESNEYVWMLKVGKRVDDTRLLNVKKQGGWLILRAPKAEQGTCYIAKFTDYSDEKPRDSKYPAYYKTILDGENDTFYMNKASYQWFKLERISILPNDEFKKISIAKSGKNAEEVIKSTRTSLMYVKNETDIELIGWK